MINQTCVLSKVLQLVAVVFLMSSAAVAAPLATEENESTLATPNKQCAGLVQNCFSKSNTKRSSCFFSASQHPFCDGTELGTLTNKRFMLEPRREEGAETAPGFLGPVIINEQCLVSFDSKLKSSLESGEIDLETLNKELESCHKNLENVLSRT